jgi:hypothetical protein
MESATISNTYTITGKRTELECLVRSVPGNFTYLHIFSIGAKKVPWKSDVLLSLSCEQAQHSTLSRGRETTTEMPLHILHCLNNERPEKAPITNFFRFQTCHKVKMTDFTDFIRFHINYVSAEDEATQNISNTLFTLHFGLSH